MNTLKIWGGMRRDDREEGGANLFIVNPFPGGLARLFSTHPPTEERVARLEVMAHGEMRPA